MYSLFVLGAGFSKPAGLPLGQELFAEILRAAKRSDLYDNILKPDIDKFLLYLERARNLSVTEEEIDFEDFISYLDVEHFLQLAGSDTWSTEGNRGQIAIRNLIALILHERERLAEKSDLSLYEEFVSQLHPTDFVITFNYDRLLERMLDRQRIPYRLYPQRFESVSSSGGIVD